jgi:hypothetical protein
MRKIKHLVFLIILVSIAILAKNCEKNDVLRGTPDCLRNKIKEELSFCLEKVYSYEYNGKTVYFLFYPCFESCWSLIDENCNIVKDLENKQVCSCDLNGIHCTEDFEKNRTNEKLIWEKK